MLETRLIFVEGLPGSGKTTTASSIVTRLHQTGFAARLIPETQSDHPLNVGGPLHPAGRTTGEQLFRRYTVQAYVAESLQRWQTFVAGCAGSNVVEVVDSYPYQNAARVLLQLDCPTDVLQTYMHEVEAITRPLAPVLIFLESSPGAESLAAIWESRGPEWKAYVVGVATACPYAVHRQLGGEEGARSVLNAYDALLRLLLGESSLPRLVLDRLNQDWPACYQQLARFLDI